MFKKRFCFLVVLSLQFSVQTFSQILFTASLDGTQENPAVVTNGKGTGWFLLSPDMNSLTFRITYAKLTGNFTASHIHIGSVGINGQVLFPITFNGNTAAGTITNLADSIVGKLMKEQLYINIHSSSFPGGEIRGQINQIEGVGFTAALDGNQENPPIATNANGTAWAILKNNASEVLYSITIAGLSSTLTASHFHNAAAGVNGPVIQNITFTDSSVNATWNGYSDNILTELLKNRIYVNVHSTNFPGGEIRGQLFRQGEIMLRANLSGNQENPPVTTNGLGTAWAVFNSDLSSLTYNAAYARLNGSFTASHFHQGVIGLNGPILQGITFTNNNSSGTWSGLADSTVRNLLKGLVYLNVHSSTSPGGEIRGQLELTKGIGFTAKLDGVQEVPPVTTNANGTAWLSYGDNVTEAEGLFYRVTIAGLSSNLTAAHFHRGAAGINGGVAQAITFSDSTVSSVWSNISDVDLGALAKGNIYLNVHTTINPSGEIRGQVQFTNIISGNIPVELTSFSASQYENKVELNWVTASEKNNLGFEIERSSDGKQFIKIGFVSGNGTTLQLSSYSFIDENLQSNIYYYRLKQIDFDGTFEYSKMIYVAIGVPAFFSLSQNYPNPFNPATTIGFTLPEQTKVSLKIYNILGSEVADVLNEVKDAGSHAINFDAGQLSSGVYIYKLSTGSGKSMSKKMTLLK